ncbi:GNAT family N-acetyltransferase [Sulfitobacter sp. SK012]|uniref:GNAT family N-acetyltransferase n=1 Tax=Sulfitobacter sp. SK012 TaxID=1389005 RepID=UPI000E0BBE8B|nr:GNAT family N-acetyltransferase [Sulfitobacter sp. SK012]AXI46221.1 GNAT family N-acetyltransferase [Sulfitobacter sp. SK012]
MFDATPATPGHALHQDPSFAAALSLCGQAPVTLPGGLILLHRKLAGIPVAMLPRADPPPDLLAQLKDVGLSRIPLILSPERPLGHMRALRLRKGISTAIIDLQQSDTVRRAALHQKWRNQLCRAEASLLRVTSASLKPDHILLSLNEDQARKRGYANWPAPLTAAFASTAPDQTRLFTASLNGTKVAHMLFLRHGHRATYHIGHSTQQGRAHHAHNLLLWTASCWLAVRGSTSLDLGLLNDSTPSHTRFKLRAGARPQLMGGTWLRWHPLARKAGT